MKRAVFAAAIAATALTFGASVHAQKTTEMHPGKAGSPHVRNRMDHRRRQHFDRVRTAVAQGPHARQGRRSVRGPRVAHRRRRGHDAQDRQGAEVRQPQRAGRHLHALHDPDRRHMAPGRQQEDRAVGDSLSEGRGSRTRANDDRQGPERGGTTHHRRAGHAGRRARSRSIGAPRAPAFLSPSARPRLRDRDSPDPALLAVRLRGLRLEPLQTSSLKPSSLQAISRNPPAYRYLRTRRRRSLRR